MAEIDQSSKEARHQIRRVAGLFTGVGAAASLFDLFNWGTGQARYLLGALLLTAFSAAIFWYARD